MSGLLLDRVPGSPRPLCIVFLGDSITDYNVYTALVPQALGDAGRPVPVCLNAGINGDSAAQMFARLDRDVFPHRPDLVTLSAGINDVFRQVSPADYEATVSLIAERIRSRKMALLLLTTTVLGPRHAQQDRQLAEYNAALRRVARKYDCQVALVNERMNEARQAGRELLDEDQVHPNFEGYRLIARAVLDALGHGDVPVPASLTPRPLPGLIRDWQVRGVPVHQMLTEAALATLEVDGSWKPYHLPERETFTDSWWGDLLRQNGFAMSLSRLVGPAQKYQGIASLEAGQPYRALFTIGGSLGTIWLNGQCVYRAGVWTGLHAGKERVPVQVREGKNTIVIETYGAFTLTCTARTDW
jgi:lysophospholipase L1-like esterase